MVFPPTTLPRVLTFTVARCSSPPTVRRSNKPPVQVKVSSIVVVVLEANSEYELVPV